MFGLLLAGCSTSDKDAPKEEAVEILYNRAASALEAGDYIAATKTFEEVERQHPYSQWATQAQLMSAYASYQDDRYDEAIIALDRFIELHPGSPDIAYAFYLKALSYYEQISDVRRDQDMTKRALDSLNALINRYPQSPYARDAILKRDLTLDHLAGQEMEIGRYYLKDGQINAAINRFRIVIKQYETTTHTPEALHRLVECYLTLGLKQEAVHIAAVLGYNYPGDAWYERTYALLDQESREKLLQGQDFFDRTLKSILSPD
jgi:outer membrane protein assembly factor BamD